MNWDIKGCLGKCIKCGREFTDGEYYYCRLFINEEGPSREDLCGECKGIKNGPSKGYSSWQGRYKCVPQEVDEEPKDPVLKQLLKKWLSSPERLHQCFCYVLAILLERSKKFNERPKIKNQEGKKQFVYEDRDTGEAYVLDDPNLTLKELGEVEKQLHEMFKQELYK